MVREVTLALFCITACAACNKKKPAEPPPSGSDGQVITGNERFGWTQATSDAFPLANIRFAVYVDGNRAELPNARCEASPGPEGFPCTAPLPRLTTGSHVLQLVSFVMDGTKVIESARSGLLVVSLRTGTAAVAQSSLNMRAFTTIDGVALGLDPMVDDLHEPIDVAFAPDGRAFVGEASATIRFLPAATGATGSVSIADTPDDRLLSLTLDPAFAQTHHIFALLVTQGPSAAPTFLLARFREQDGALLDRIVILENVPAAPKPEGSLRFGPDAKLYVALDDGGVEARAGDLASRNGKVLRMNADGSTPDDQANLSPVYSYGFRGPHALAWQPATGRAWLADQSAAREQLLYAVEHESPRVRGRVRAAFRLPAGTATAGAMFYRGRAIAPFENNLFIASSSGPPLLRFGFDTADPLKIVSTELLLNPDVGPVRLVAQAPDGSMYIGTRTALSRVVATSSEAARGPSHRAPASD